MFETAIDCFTDIWYYSFMDKETGFIVKDELTYGRGYVYSLQYHLVWCTKYRKKVLRGEIDAECREMLAALAEEYKFGIMAMEIMKGNLARRLFIRHPELKKQLWGGHLWNPSYCAVTVRDRSREQVERYILTQKDRA